MKRMYITPLAEYGYGHPIEDIILGIKKTTTRKKSNYYAIGEQRELAKRISTKDGKKVISYGVIVEITDINLINTKDITEQYAIDDGIHPTQERTAKENLMEIFRHFYKHIPKEMVCISLKFVGYTDEFAEEEWKGKVEAYRRKKDE